MSTREPRDPRGAKSAIRKRLAFERKNLDYLTEMHERHKRLIRTKEEEVKRQMDEFITKERAKMLSTVVRATEYHSKAAVARAVGVTTPTIYRWIKEHEDNQKTHRRTHARETE